jgi:hypothetical protein
MRPAQFATGITLSTLAILGGIELTKASAGSSVAQQRQQSEERRSHYLQLTAKEIISNGKQYLEFDFDGAIGQQVPQFNQNRLSTFRSSRSGLYYAIGRLNQEMTIIAIFSREEVQTAINLEQGRINDEKR